MQCLFAVWVYTQSCTHVAKRIEDATSLLWVTKLLFNSSIIVENKHLELKKEKIGRQNALR